MGSVLPQRAEGFPDEGLDSLSTAPNERRSKAEIRMSCSHNEQPIALITSPISNPAYYTCLCRKMLHNPMA